MDLLAQFLQILYSYRDVVIASLTLVKSVLTPGDEGLDCKKRGQEGRKIIINFRTTEVLFTTGGSENNMAWPWHYIDTGRWCGDRNDSRGRRWLCGCCEVKNWFTVRSLTDRGLYLLLPHSPVLEPVTDL